jgi:hypothetical protein
MSFCVGSTGFKRIPVCKSLNGFIRSLSVIEGGTPKSFWNCHEFT